MCLKIFIEVISLIYIGKEFQSFAPAYLNVVWPILLFTFRTRKGSDKNGKSERRSRRERRWRKNKWKRRISEKEQGGKKEKEDGEDEMTRRASINAEKLKMNTHLFSKVIISKNAKYKFDPS